MEAENATIATSLAIHPSLSDNTQNPPVHNSLLNVVRSLKCLELSKIAHSICLMATD